MGLLDGNITPATPTVSMYAVRVKRRLKNIFRQFYTDYNNVYDFITDNPNGFTTQEMLAGFGDDVTELQTLNQAVQDVFDLLPEGLKNG